VLVEAAWNYRYGASVSKDLALRREATSEPVRRIAEKAQMRLNRRYWHLMAKGKPAPEVAVAVARELLGFVWAIAREVELPEAKKTSR
jgi:hypothetical protein